MPLTGPQWFRRYGRWLKWSATALAVLAVIDGFYLTRLWPDWETLAGSGSAIPRSSFIRDYEARRHGESHWPVLRWNPVPLERIPGHVVRAVIIAEDARFYEHDGFDFAAIKEAFHYNLEKGKVARGASTITQQTAKNLFLSPSRDPLRKWHEAVLTWGMERNLSKARILELYLNVVELGRGIYGVDAAAWAYWNKPVSALTLEQAAELAATLPSPRRSNPRTRTAFFLEHSAKIQRRLYSVLGKSTPDATNDNERLGPAAVPWYRRPAAEDDQGRE